MLWKSPRRFDWLFLIQRSLARRVTCQRTLSHMQQRQLNWADLNGMLAVFVGPVGGIATSAGRGAAWPLVVFFAILGCGAGIISTKILGRIAYSCLFHPRNGIGSLIGYLVLSLAMPVTR